MRYKLRKISNITAIATNIQPIALNCQEPKFSNCLHNRGIFALLQVLFVQNPPFCIIFKFFDLVVLPYVSHEKCNINF